MRSSLVLAALAFAGCDLSTTVERDFGPPLQTDRLEYTFRTVGSALAVDIPYTYTNRAPASVYIVNCLGGFGLRLERLEGEDWVMAWGPVLLSCLSPPIVIRPGEQFEDTLRVWGSTPGTSQYPQFDRADPSGVYRIVWDDALWSFQDRLPFGEQIPEELRISNQFILRK